MKKLVFMIGQLSNGGAERVVSLLANSLSNDYEVSIIMVIKNEIEYDIYKNVNVYYTDVSNNNKIIRICERLYKIKKLLKKISPDIIISFTTEINLYAICSNTKKTKLIISERNDPYNDPPNIVVRKIRDKLYKYCDGVVFQTTEAQQYFLNKVNSLSTVILNPIKDNLPLQTADIEISKKIVTIARLYSQKNLFMLIKAFSIINQKYPEYDLEIYGDGPLLNELVNYTKQLNIENKVKFMGFCKNVHSKILDADIFVLTSNYEGLSNSMIEALAMGIPTICTDCPIYGARMLIKNNINGLLVPVNDIQALTERIELLINNRDFRNYLSINGSKIRECLNIDKITKEWKCFMERVVMSDY